MNELVIKREFWLRGEGTSNSYLLRSFDKKMCCLGFLARSCGYGVTEINEMCTPSGVAKIYGDHFPYSVLIHKDINVLNSDMTIEAMGINDDKYLSESDREEKLTRLFQQNFNIQLLFED